MRNECAIAGLQVQCITLRVEQAPQLRFHGHAWNAQLQSLAFSNPNFHQLNIIYAGVAENEQSHSFLGTFVLIKYFKVQCFKSYYNFAIRSNYVPMRVPVYVCKHAYECVGCVCVHACMSA